LKNGGGPISNIDLSSFMSSQGEAGGVSGSSNNNNVGGDSVPAAFLRQALKEKADMEERINVYELLMSSIEIERIPTEKEGGDGPSVGEGTNAAFGTPNDDAGSTRSLDAGSIMNLVDELSHARRTIQDHEANIGKLKSKLEIFGDLEEAKLAAEERDQEAIQGLAEESDKIAREREQLHNDRSRVMAEREAMDEKESRLGMLLSVLDERDSKLRQHMSMIQDQKQQWEASVRDLRRREDLVMDWQQKHSARENRLRERDEAFEVKVKELQKRENAATAQELELKKNRKKQEELEQRVQTKLSQSMEKDQLYEEEVKRVSDLENGIKKREDEMEMKERELVFKRRELEGWDSLLRERDNKLTLDLKGNDEREEEIFYKEKQIREREMELREAESRFTKRENDCNLLHDKYTAGLTDIQSREKVNDDLNHKLHAWDEELSAKEVELSSKEAKLKQVQARLRDVDEREERLDWRISELEKARSNFYENEVQGITKRHREEIEALEDLVKEQLKIVKNFQDELNQTKLHLAERMEDNDRLTELLREKDEIVKKLKVDLDDAAHTRDNAVETLRQQRHLRVTSKGTRMRADSTRSVASEIDLGHFRQSYDPNFEESDDDNVNNMNGPESGSGQESKSGALGLFEAQFGVKRGEDGVTGIAVPQRSFLLQLAETQSMLENVLKQHQERMGESNNDTAKGKRQRRSSMLSREQQQLKQITEARAAKDNAQAQYNEQNELEIKHGSSPKLTQGENEYRYEFRSTAGAGSRNDHDRDREYALRESPLSLNSSSMQSQNRMNNNNASDGVTSRGATPSHMQTIFSNSEAFSKSEMQSPHSTSHSPRSNVPSLNKVAEGSSFDEGPPIGGSSSIGKGLSPPQLSQGDYAEARQLARSTAKISRGQNQSSNHFSLRSLTTGASSAAGASSTAGTNQSISRSNTQPRSRVGNRRQSSFQLNFGSATRKAAGLDR
jgi:hypothetical protein